MTIYLDFIANNFVWFALAVGSGGMLLWSFRPSGKGISSAEATLLINREDALVLDVRDTNEFSAGHLPQARHIALTQLDTRVSELAKYKDKPLIVYCAAGHRSSTACAKLRKQGFGRVHNLTGGINAWRDAGLPLTSKV